MSALISELIDAPDTVEIVRDQIAAILSLELQNQSALAQSAGIPNVKEFEVPVYVENARPYDGDSVPIRFVNITLPRVISISGNARLGSQKEQSTIFIDCVACGNDSGDFRDDKSSSLRAWRVARIVRRILMSDAYTYLGLRGVVGSRLVTSLEAGTPEKSEREKEASLFFTIIRISLEVQFAERYIEMTGVPLESIAFEVDPITGEVRV
jgi:hypothetical protein